MAGGFWWTSTLVNVELAGPIHFRQQTAGRRNRISLSVKGKDVK
jgi:hypothetical protein